jgi:hypothetical protein
MSGRKRTSRPRSAPYRTRLLAAGSLLKMFENQLNHSLSAILVLLFRTLGI